MTTFAVDPRWRRRGVGERLLLALLDLAVARQAREATLEVRLSNLPARKLYEKHGFRPVGIRPRYYSDNGEDALIMTTEPLASPAMVERMARLRAALDDGPVDATPSDAPPAHTADDGAMSGPARARDRVLLRRDRRRARRGRQPDPRERRCQPGRAPCAGGRDRARGRRPGAPALDPAGARRGLVDRWRRRGTMSGRSRSPAGRASPGSLLVGINVAKTLAWVHDKPFVRREPPRRPRVCGVAARPRRSPMASRRSSRSSRWWFAAGTPSSSR